jgi:ankyrin repeat protein
MLPLNPFLRAFFRSTLPAQCSPAHAHLLLVPTTDFLLTHRDRETNVLYADLVTSEDFLASHVLRIPGAPPAAGHLPADGSATFKESRSKAKQLTTLNGKSVVVKDAFVYSNKGFRALNQAQLLSDVIYFPDAVDAPPWIVYYISRPLIGSPEGVVFLSTAVDPRSFVSSFDVSRHVALAPQVASPSYKKDVKSFGDIMNHFPTISRQMQPGLERILNEFRRAVEKPLPAIPASESVPTRPRRRSSVSSLSSYSHSVNQDLANGVPPVFHTDLEMTHQEEDLRSSLEVAITAAIDLFQMVDKQQLSLLGSTTDLTGALVERMIERYITEQVHDAVLFPRLCSFRKPEDAELEARIRQMVDIDICQVGLSIDTDRPGKKRLAHRLAKGVDCFKKMGVASSPQEMLQILLEAQKIITNSDRTGNDPYPSQPEKPDVIMTINADTLVSLLLIVVIRSPVRHLQARLSYMRHFIFIDEVESGEFGYALSTFEAVLSYLSHDSSGLRRSSLRNRRLWQAAKSGNVPELREVLELHFEPEGQALNGSASKAFNFDTGDSLRKESLPVYDMTSNGTGSLSHVFPFQAAAASDEPEEKRSRMKKRVSVQSRSTSSSSGYSLRSILTFGSDLTGFEGDLSIEILAQTQSPDGDSVLMMAIQSRQKDALKYLLNLKKYYPIRMILHDENNSNTTLLSAAIQTGNTTTADMILDFIVDNAEDDEVVRRFIARQDVDGRCAAHYLFEYPSLIQRIGRFIPWTLKDKNGQTPLFALCRSYDHEDYKWMVSTALAAAAVSQGDGEPLRLDDHIDNKGNTLLHIINDYTIAREIMQNCDCDVNASNDKQFTPLMVASKYGRTDMVRTLFRDPRVDMFARDLRGLTAMELAKDDEVRNGIDDLVLLSTPPTFGRRVTGVVRSFFVEDGTIRFIVKSSAQNPDSSITVTTCRRTLTDFEDLARWLALEHPASWIPYPNGFLSPFLLPSRPSRSVARDIQLRLDSFLNILLSHSTFATHEMVWEFFLVPDMDPSVLAERSRRKAELRSEMVRDEFTPIVDVREVELFVAYAKESVRNVHAATKAALRRTNNLRAAQADLHDASTFAAGAFSLLADLPPSHAAALRGAARALAPTDWPPAAAFARALAATTGSAAALLAALARPSDQAARIVAARRALERAQASLGRAAAAAADRAAGPSSGWPRPLGLVAVPLLDEARARARAEAAARVERAAGEAAGLGRELRYTQTVVAGELAAWEEERVRVGRRACRALARRMVVVERERLEVLRRAGRLVGLDVGRSRARPK